MAQPSHDPCLWRPQDGTLAPGIGGTEAVVVWQVADDIASSTLRQLSFNSLPPLIVSALSAHVSEGVVVAHGPP